MKQFVPILLAALLWVGCGSSEKSDVLVRDAILHYLANRTDLSMRKMELQIDRVEYEGEGATADVTISARDDAQARMQMAYQLRRTESGWEVVPPSQADRGAAHGAIPGGAEPGAGALPPGHPPTGESEGENPLPQGHPPVGGEPAEPSSELPEGHPRVGSQ